MPIWLVVLLFLLATHRVTRLITRDQIPIFKIPRDTFVNRWGAPQADTAGNPLPRELRNVSYGGKKTNAFARSIAYLWECDWCASVWIAAALATGTYFYGDERWWQFGLLAVAASSVTGLIAQREPD